LAWAYLKGVSSLISLHYIFGCRSAHLAYHVHKSGRKTSIIIVIIIIIICSSFLQLFSLPTHRRTKKHNSKPFNPSLAKLYMVLDGQNYLLMMKNVAYILICQITELLQIV